MISQQRHIETQCKPLCCTEKHNTEECMDEVLWKYKLEKKKYELEVWITPSKTCIVSSILEVSLCLRSLLRTTNKTAASEKSN